MSHPEQAEHDGPGADGAALRLAVLLSYSGDGGVERMMNQLIAGMLEQGHSVDVLVLKTAGGHFGALPDGARVLRLARTHAGMSAGEIARYLRRERPHVLLAAKDRAGRAALRARQRAGTDTRVVIRIGNTLSQSLAHRGGVRRWLRYRPIRRWYPRADAVIAVSDGVAEDVVATSGVSAERVHVVPNPVVTPTLYERARATPAHAWFHDGGPPIILAVGRLTEQKDFPTLLHAFARLRARTDARLIVLGEGEERSALERLARDLSVQADLDMPGFLANPYGYMANAQQFVLSSAWEGSPNALTEALALGRPVVATDCRSGPREILEGGRYGALVPVGDAEALADAMVRTLRDPLPAATLKQAVTAYTREASVTAYLRVLGLDSEPKRPHADFP
ncbi:MAG: glycosyltransferase [Halofilum sp. (in: g-proteobacteria)]